MIYYRLRTDFWQKMTLKKQNTPKLFFSIYMLVIIHKALTEVSQQCPNPADISPCTCSIKKNGLDVICEFTDMESISKAMDSLKKRQNSIIFYLKLRHNRIPKLHGFVFLGLDIHHLTIHNSSLQGLEETSLSSIGRALTQLDVSQNSLVSVPSAALKKLHHLLILNLNHNKISSLHGEAFQGLDTLEILTLYENKLMSIENNAFRGLDKRKLKRLNLGGNELSEVPSASLISLNMLRRLELQENLIFEIKKEDFKGLKSLDFLGLAHNRLTDIPGQVFSHLSSLNSLELEGNRIVLVDPDAFMGLEENLQYLKLGNNNLHSVPSDALRRLHRLRHLDLKANNITFIPEDAFFGYGDSITFLDLQKNLIHILPSTVFETLNSLEILNLKNNKLTSVTEEVTENIIDTLKFMDMTDNPLICDCELVWFKIWLDGLGDKTDDAMLKKKTFCSMPTEHREYLIQRLPFQELGCARIKIYERALSMSGTKYNTYTSSLVIIIATLTV